MEQRGYKGKASSHMPWYKGSNDEEGAYLGYMNVGGRNHGT